MHGIFWMQTGSHMLQPLVVLPRCMRWKDTMSLAFKGSKLRGTVASPWVDQHRFQDYSGLKTSITDNTGRVIEL